MTSPDRYQAENKVRFVTAASLFDGHDAAINIMRRILQAHGAEVIHLGHNRSVKEIVDAAIQEDAQGIAVSSYQGGHIEFFKYMIDLLKERGASHIKVFGGGGGVIVPREIKELEDYGITKIFSPDDGREMGLDGMIDYMIEGADFDPATLDSTGPLGPGIDQWLAVSRAITRIEEGLSVETPTRETPAPVLGITGTGGAGKSSLTDELVLRFLADHPDRTIAILSVDPTKRKTGGALLGDRIRLNTLGSDRVFMRSLATRQAHRALTENIGASIHLCQSAGFDLVLVESSGIGQADSEIVDISDLSLYVMTPEYDRHARLRRLRGHQQVRPAKGPRRRARCAQAVPPQPPALRRPSGRRAAGLWHGRQPVPRPRRQRPLPGVGAALRLRIRRRLDPRRHSRRARRRAAAPPGDPR